MSDVEVTCEGQALLCEDSIVEFFAGEVAKLAMDGLEDFCDGSRAESSLAKHVFLACSGIELDTRYSGSFLPAVVLFLHQEIHLVQSIHPGTILLLVIL